MKREEISLNQNVVKLEMKEGSYANGLISEAQSQISTIGPHEPLMKLEHQPGAALGLSQSGINFRMGPTSPK